MRGETITETYFEERQTNQPPLAAQSMNKISTFPNDS